MTELQYLCKKAFLISGVLLGCHLFSHALPYGELSLTHHAFTDEEKSQIREWFLNTWEKNKDQAHAEEKALETLKTSYEKEKATLQPLFMSMNVNQNQKVIIEALTAQDLKADSDKEGAKIRIKMRVLFLRFLVRQPEFSGFRQSLKTLSKMIKNKHKGLMSIKSSQELSPLKPYLKKTLFQNNQFEIHKNLIYALTRFLEACELEVHHISQVIHSYSYSHQNVKSRIKAVRKHLVKSNPWWMDFISVFGPGISPVFFESCQRVFFP